MSVEELFQKGYTTLPSLISKESCNKLKDELDARFHPNLSYNYLPGHYQIHLPKDKDNFPEEILFQSKIHNWRHPIWMLQANGISVNLTFNSLGQRNCYIGKLSSFKGQWNDILIKTEYSFEGGKKELGESYIEFYLNGHMIMFHLQ